MNRAGIRVAKTLGVPCVVKQRGFEWRSWDVARLAQQVDLFLPDSATVAADVARLGVSRDRILVTYCAVGMRASLMAFAARYAGFDTRIYVGSWQDWSRQPGYPVIR